MKRIFATLCMGAVLLGVYGCAMQPTPGNVNNRMDGAFTTEVTMTTADSETKGILTRYGNDAWSVTFTEPAALDGVKLDFLDDEVIASYKGLEFSVPQSAQAIRTMLSELMDIVDDMALEPEIICKQNEEGAVCEGEIDEGKYTLTFDKEGIPKEFSLPPYGLTITFDTFTESGNAQPSESTATTCVSTETTTTQTTTTAASAAAAATE
ncbi:MAG: hypothetical protein IKK51_10750 [Oscillospiraceae bacterium]|nr:hypothetical protein [Oscillospiraceae bacterium]